MIKDVLCMYAITCNIITRIFSQNNYNKVTTNIVKRCNQCKKHFAIYI